MDPLKTPLFVENAFQFIRLLKLEMVYLEHGYKANRPLGAEDPEIEKNFHRAWDMKNQAQKLFVFYVERHYPKNGENNLEAGFRLAFSVPDKTGVQVLQPFVYISKLKISRQTNAPHL
jgi:hypothetical protein